MTTQKKDYEIAIDAYTDAEKAYRQFEEYFLNGDCAADIAMQSGGDREKFKAGFQAAVERLQTMLEDVNAKGVSAKNAFRSAVQLAPTQQRGPEGKATTLSYGPLTVNSATKRWLDAESLLKGAQKSGILDRLLALTSFDKNGKEYHLVEQIWKIDFENVLKWLKENNLQTLIDASYDEKEETPRVGGIKGIAFLGEKIEKS